MDNFIGEIRLFAGNYAPQGWAFCNGQTLSISQNTALFSLLGTAYGGNGTTTFQLPDLQGRFPLHAGDGGAAGLSAYFWGEATGTATEVLTQAQIPHHDHQLDAALSPTTNAAGPAVALSPVTGGALAYRAPTNLRPLAPETLASSGSNAPHENRQPYLALSFIIALQGIYPPRS